MYFRACLKKAPHGYTPGGGKTAFRSALKPPKLKEIAMKNTLRAALVMLVLAGAYAGISTPAPAMNKPAITVADGGAPVPTTPNYPVPQTPTAPTSPKSSSL